MKLTPAFDNVLIKVLEPEDKVAGIYLPESAQEKTQRGKIIAVGKGKYNDQGKFVANTFKVGETVLYRKYGSAQPFAIDAEEYVLVKEEDILATEK